MVEENLLWCYDHEEWTDRDLFWNDSTRPTGKQSRCIECHRIRNEEAYQKKRHTVKDRQLRNNFGINLSEYYDLLEIQGGRCAVCFEPETKICYSKVVDLAVDHDHSHCKGPKGCRECVRGLLCDSCNRGIGNTERGRSWTVSDEIWESAQRYLESGLRPFSQSNQRSVEPILSPSNFVRDGELVIA